MEKESGKRLSPSRPRTLRSAELFAGAKEVLIEHDQQVYRLMITRAGKLILNK
jgi:hemin uptake protein HemP